tara:strand:+ start:225 stop:470 length:246 start_codon:yes stop_codon:yes gene_type:complete
MILDKYTKFILTLIAIGIIGINFYLFKVNIVGEVNAAPGNTKVVVTNFGAKYVYLTTDDGRFGCKVSWSKYRSKWNKLNCG